MLKKIHINLERNLLVSETWHKIFLEQNCDEIVTENLYFFLICTKGISHATKNSY